MISSAPYKNHINLHFLDLYQKLQINDISIVTGYLKEKIFFPNIKFFENNYYDTTNMVETLFCAREKINNSTK